MPELNPDQLSALSQSSPWLPTQTATALASSGSSDQEVQQNTEAIRQSVAQHDDGWHSVFDDPVLHKTMSPLVALRQYASESLGPAPIAEVNLKKSQEAFQHAGYASDLPADGVWTSAWNSVLAQYKHDLTQSQLHSGGGGGFSIGDILEAPTRALLPTQAADAIIGFWKGVPTELRHLTATLASGVGGISHDILHPASIISDTPGTAQWEGSWGSEVNNILASKENLTPAEFEAGHGKNIKTGQVENPGKALGSAISDIGSILSIAGTAGAAGSVKGAVMAEAAANAAAEGGPEAAAAAKNALTEQYAYQGPGVIARSAVEPGLAKIGDAPFLKNMPILGRSGPWAADLAEGGEVSGAERAAAAYYKTRGIVSASIYRYPVARVAGTALTQGTLLGAGIRGAAAVSQVGGNDTPLSEAVQNTHVVSAIDAAVGHRLEFSIAGQQIKPSINWLQFGVHGPAGSASGTVHAAADAVVGGVDEGLQDVGALGAYEQASGKSMRELDKYWGGHDNVLKFVHDKWARFAATHAAEVKKTENLVALTNDPTVVGKLNFEDSTAILRNEEQRLLRPDNAEELGQAMRELRSMPGELSSRWKLDIEKNIDRVHDDPARAQQYMSDSNLMTNKVMPWVDGVKGDDGVTRKVMIRDNGSIYADTPQNLGFAQRETMTQQQAHPALDQLEQRLEELDRRKQVAQSQVDEVPPFDVEFDPQAAAAWQASRVKFPEEAEYQQWSKDARDLLYEMNGNDATSVASLHGEKQMLDFAREQANHLASEVYLTPDAPRQLVDAVNELRAHGRKLVTGTDIGWDHVFRHPLGTVDGNITYARKIARTVGISPEFAANSDAARYQKAGRLRAIRDEAMVDPRFTPVPGVDHLTANKMFEDPDFIQPDPSRATRAMMQVFHMPRESMIQDKLNTLISAKDLNDLSPAEARRFAEAEATRDVAGWLQVSDIPRKTAIAALTSREKAIERMGQEWVDLYRPNGGGIFDEPSAELVYKAVVKGNSEIPYSMMGLSKLDYLFRSSMGFAGNSTWQRAAGGAVLGGAAGLAANPDQAVHGDLSAVAAGAVAGGVTGALGGDKVGWAIANTPNRIRSVVNSVRFRLSPFFSLRRLVKTNLKMGLNGIPVTMRPLNAIGDASEIAEARRVLTEVRPNYGALFNDVTDSADRYLQQQDIYGMYNVRNFEAYAAYDMKKAGLSNDEIGKHLDDIFAYAGKNGQIGRSQIERSTNFLFFPWSFEKRLYNTAGSYLLDHAGQRVLLSNAVAAYHQFSVDHPNTPGAAQWITDHMPIMQEAARLNAFEHGISLGEAGGINRPLLNMFLPQSWSSSTSNYATLERFIPAVKDFHRVFGEVASQGNIAVATAHRMLYDISNSGIGSGIDKVAGVSWFAQNKNYPTALGAPVVEDEYSQNRDAFALRRQWVTAWKDVLDANAGKAQADQAKFPMSPEWGEWAGEPITKSNIDGMIAAVYPAYDPTKAVDYATKNARDVQNWVRTYAPGSSERSYAQGFVDDVRSLASALNSTNYSSSDLSAYTSQLRAAAQSLAERDAAFYAIYQKNFQKALGPLEKVQA